MKTVAVIAAVLLALVMALPGRTADPDEVAPIKPMIDAPGVPDPEVSNPEVFVRLAVQQLSTIDFRKDAEITYTRADVPYIRFFDFYATPDKWLQDDTLLFKLWVNMLSFEGGVHIPQEVEGSGGRLFWVDIRWYGWNAAAFRAVAEREPWHQEPWIDHEHSELLRRLIDVPVSKTAAKKGIYQVQGVVRGDWFVRETMESARSPSYYDLLFARFRFKLNRVKTGSRIKKIWPGGPDREGKEFPKGMEYEAEEYIDEVTFTDFPKNVEEWDQAFGLDKIRAFTKDAKLDTDFGSIVEGGEDNPAKGSIVALHNRILQLQQSVFGITMRSYDVFDTTGIRDYTETLIFKGKSGFTKGNGVEAVFDAGELLYYLPNGGLAGFLIDAKGNRADIAASQAANLNNEPRLAPGVRNVRDCMKCHAPTGGFITPGSTEREFEAAGGKAKFKDREKEIRYRQFFFDWEDRAEGAVKSFNRLIERTTRTDRAPGWTGAQFAKNLTAFIERYDAPVTMAVAAAEIGVPVVAIKSIITERDRVRLLVGDAAEAAGEGKWPAAAKAMNVRFEIFKYIARLSPDKRPNQLALGIPIPRRTFDIDVYPKLQMIRSYLVEVEKKEFFKKKP